MNQSFNPLASKRPHEMAATVKGTISGDFCHLKAGERVRAWKDKDGTYTVERVKWRGSTVPLCNSITSVPEYMLAFL